MSGCRIGVDHDNLKRKEREVWNGWRAWHLSLNAGTLICIYIVNALIPMCSSIFLSCRGIAYLTTTNSYLTQYHLSMPEQKKKTFPVTTLPPTHPPTHLNQPNRTSSTARSPPRSLHPYPPPAARARHSACPCCAQSHRNRRDRRRG